MLGKGNGPLGRRNHMIPLVRFYGRGRDVLRNFQRDGDSVGCEENRSAAFAAPGPLTRRHIVSRLANSSLTVVRSLADAW